MNKTLCFNILIFSKFFILQIELTTKLREKGKLFRKRRKIQKTLPGYEDLIFGCYNEYSAAREDFVVDCNEFDYYPEPEDNFDAETLQRNNLNKDNWQK